MFLYSSKHSPCLASLKQLSWVIVNAMSLRLCKWTIVIAELFHFMVSMRWSQSVDLDNGNNWKDKYTWLWTHWNWVGAFIVESFCLVMHRDLNHRAWSRWPLLTKCIFHQPRSCFNCFQTTSFHWLLHELLRDISSCRATCWPALCLALLVQCSRPVYYACGLVTYVNISFFIKQEEA